MLFPLIDRKSWFTGFFPLIVAFTLRKYVFIETSTPMLQNYKKGNLVSNNEGSNELRMSDCNFSAVHKEKKYTT